MSSAFAPAEKEALQRYVASSGFINKPLRAGAIDQSTPLAIEAALAKSVMKHDATVFRGLCTPPQEMCFTRAGDTFCDSAFLSTSSSPGTAMVWSEDVQHWCQHLHTLPRYFFSIEVPAGQLALDMSRFGGTNAWEKEILFPRRTVLEFVSQSESKVKSHCRGERKLYRIKAKMLPQYVRDR